MVRHANSHRPTKVLYGRHGSREWDGDGVGVVSIGNADAEVGMHGTPGMRVQIHLVNKRVKGRKAKRTDFWGTAGS